MVRNCGGIHFTSSPQYSTLRACEVGGTDPVRKTNYPKRKALRMLRGLCLMFYHELNSSFRVSAFSSNTFRTYLSQCLASAEELPNT